LINLPVIFDGTGSSDPDGGMLLYAWDFGDGSPIGKGVKPTHTYTAVGVRNVTLTVIDEADTPASDSAAALIASGDLPPVADAGGPYKGKKGKPMTFDGTGSDDPDGGNLLYAWDFGDGNIGSGPTPDHTYDEKGTYNVILTVRDDSGATDANVTEVEIKRRGGSSSSGGLCSLGPKTATAWMAGDLWLLLASILGLGLWRRTRRTG
jgi:hypothetical protein